MSKLLSIFFMLAIFIAAAHAHAADRTFVVYPFTVNAPKSYNYLGKAVPGTIQSKLSQPGRLTGSTGTARVSSAAEARKALNSSKADYAIWGSINVVGNDCTIQMNSVGKDGATWSKSASGPMSALTGTVQNLVSAMGNEALGVSVAARPVFNSGQGQRGQMVNQMNSDLVFNETGQQQVYLNPQFRYQGAGANDGSRLTSQRIKEYMVDMALGDFNGDGKTEVAVLGQHDLTIYIWEGGRLKELGKTTINKTNYNFSMRAIDLNRDGADDLVISSFEEDSNQPLGFFYSFKNNKFSQVAPRVAYFVSVLRMPPTFTPTLVGQGYDSIRLFSPGVHLMVRGADGKYGLGARIGLPTGANVFNVAWIPAGKGQDSDMLVMLTQDEKLRVYANSNSSNALHTTMDAYSGSATGMDFYKSMPGTGLNKDGNLPTKYFAPMRMIAVDLGHTGENVLLLNKPISTASSVLDRYRYFPQGEIHALYWDGVGMGLKWKTRRIRGSVAEVDLGDINNDGILDLVVGINTSPELGVGPRNSMITAYPLDVSQTDPNTPADLSDFEITPGR